MENIINLTRTLIINNPPKYADSLQIIFLGYTVGSKVAPIRWVLYDSNKVITPTIVKDMFDNDIEVDVITYNWKETNSGIYYLSESEFDNLTTVGSYVKDIILDYLGLVEE